MIKLTLTVFLTFILITLNAQTFVENASNVNIDQLHVEPQIMGGGAAFFDFNNDNFDDLYLTGGMGRDHLYINNQDGTFTEASISVGIGVTANHNTVGVATGDIDNDGYRDIFVTTDQFSANLLFKNNGDGTFSDISTQAGITDSAWSASASFGDYNLDGYLDIYVANYVDFPFVPGIPFYDTTVLGVNNYFYVNNGDGTFSEKADFLGIQDNGTALSVIFTDFDNDNDVDIYLGNDFGMDYNPNFMFENLYPIDSFANITQSSGTGAAIYTMGTVAGDYNEDGLLDYYVSNMADNILYHNNGNNTFTDLATSLTVGVPAVTSWGGFFFDYDNDSYIDLFAASGQMIFREPNQYQINNLFKNNNGTNYSDVALTEGLADSSRSRGAAYSDFDNDGDIDFVIVNVHVDSNTNDRTWFMENQSTSAGNYIKVKLIGTVNNRDGFGAHVEVKSNGRTLLRAIDGGSGYLSHSSSIAHFGLGSLTTIDSIVVHWPGGAVQLETNININQQIEIIENASTHQYICLGDSLLLSGEYQYTSGSYTDTLTNMSGGDSLINTILHVSQPIYNQNITICSGDSIFLGGSYQNSAGIYFDSLTSFINCDSIVRTQLFVKSVDTTYSSVSICDNDSILLSGQYQNTSNTYTDVYTTFEGCDSVVVTNLIVNPTFSVLASISICEGDSIFLEGSYQKNGGVYTDILASSLGCDSVINTTLIINGIAIVDTNISICENDSIFLEGNYQNTPNTYIDTLTSNQGCDSIVRTQLSILPTQQSNVTEQVCNGDSILINGAYISSNGNYTSTYTSSFGCDSIVQTAVTILPSYYTSIQQEICDGDSLLINGNYEFSAGAYSNIMATTQGCDSILETVLIVNPNEQIFIDTTIYMGDSILIGGAYQNTNGSYSDTLSTSFGCDSIITTNLTLVSPSLVNSKTAKLFKCYPNPTNGVLIIEKQSDSQNIEAIFIVNSIGELVFQTSNKNTITSIDISNLPNGIYQLHIKTEKTVESLKIILQ